ncbi:hypothetical protein X209_03372, partial [Mycobacterium tuberculosis BTB12-294]
MCAVAVSAPRPVSSDPKPREGTETRKRSTSLTILFSRRQTQNPERGRKPISGTATLREDTPSRQTQNPERGRKLDCANWLGADPGGRQTQNPERGRKREEPSHLGLPPAGRQTQNP